MAPPGLQVLLEQQAFLLLTEAERQTLAYYLQEYQEGHIAVHALVMALFELFNTHAKVEQDLRQQLPAPPLSLLCVCVCVCRTVVMELLLSAALHAGGGEEPGGSAGPGDV